MVKEIRMLRHQWLTMFLLAGLAAAQSVPDPPTDSAQKPAPAKSETAPAPAPKAEAPKAEPPKLVVYTVKTGTRIPLCLLNSISTKHSETGDTVYLQTAFPVLVRGRIVIPVGTYVTGTVTEVKRPSRAKGPAELYVRFETLTLPNGVTRHFNARLGGLDGTIDAKVDRAEGKVTADSNKSGEARTVAETGATGASIGGIVGAGSSAPLTGLGIGAAAGAAAGLIGILASHGPDAVLPKGTTVEMVLDRPLNFNELDLL
jgi:type IV secretion system protein VirB10